MNIKKIAKVVALAILAVVLLLLAVITVAVNYLRPEKLTPIVERYANEYLNAEVGIDRIDISFWSTFPRFDLDVQGLDVRTKAFEKLHSDVRMTLPVYADSLLSVGRLKAAVNIPALLVGNISLYDITITSPEVNLIQATPESWSLDIFPASAEDTSKDGPLEIPDFSMGTFEIEGGFPIRYVSIPDSMDLAVNLATTRLKGDGAPVYSLSVEGLTSASVSEIVVNSLQVGMGGDINWSASHPLRSSLKDFRLAVGDVSVTLNATVDFEDELMFESFDLTLPPTRFRDIIDVIPTGMRGELAKVESDMALGIGLKLTGPFALGVDSIPSFEINVSVPKGSASYDGMKLEQFELQADAVIDGVKPDNSVLNISRLVAQGEGMGFSLTGTVTDVVSDAKVSGTFRGGLNVEHLPKIILAKLPYDVKGRLVADCTFDFRKSYLTRENFHRVLLSGGAVLTGLEMDMPDMPASVYARSVELRLGTNSSFVNGGAMVDSLLTASLKVDTISCAIDGMDMQGRGLLMGVGCRNTASSIDTTAINPIGGRISAQRFSLRASEDSSRIYLRDASIGGALLRYKGEKRRPQLRLDIATKGALYGDRVNRAMLSDARMSLTVHPSSTPAAERRRARIDSLRRLFPDLTYDSISAMSRAIARASRKRVKRDSAAVSQPESVREKIEVDNSVRRILRNWDANGSLHAERVRVFTPLFPLRNRISGLDLDFSTDSIAVHDTHVNVGKSDFRIEGYISNISRSLTSRRGSQSIKVNFNLTSDTINVNEIAEAVFAGAAFADSGTEAGMSHMDENSDESALQSSVDIAVEASDSASVLIIPANLEAKLNVRARNIIYSDLAFRDFRGTLNAFDGALNLSRLGARSDVGSINLNALYTAPTKYDASFAFGMYVKGFRIREFLDLVPSLDTLMPMLHGIDGVINADIAATTRIDTAMNLDIPSLKAAVKLSGDSLVVMDEETFRTIGKWLLFKDKTHNMIDSMTVEMIVDNSQMQMFPFMFNLDRYKLGVMGNNDLAMNFKYHIAVLKSPLPFKFGINVSGNPDDMKIRLGRAKFNEKNMAKSISIADTTRVNLVEQIRNVFSRGVRNAKIRQMDFSKIGQAVMEDDLKGDTISGADSIYFIREGLIPAPDTVAAMAPQLQKNKKIKKRR